MLTIVIMMMMMMAIIMLNDDDNYDSDADDGVAVAVAILSPAHTWCPSRSWTRVARVVRVARGSLGKVLLTSSTTVSYSLFSNDIHFHHIPRPEVGCIE